MTKRKAKKHIKKKKIKAAAKKKGFKAEKFAKRFDPVSLAKRIKGDIKKNPAMVFMGPSFYLGRELYEEYKNLSPEQKRKVNKVLISLGTKALMAL